MYTAFRITSFRTTYQGPPDSGTPFRCPMVWNQKPAGQRRAYSAVKSVSTQLSKALCNGDSRRQPHVCGLTISPNAGRSSSVQWATRAMHCQATLWNVEAFQLTLVVAQDLIGVLVDEGAGPLAQVLPHKLRVVHLRQ